LSRTGLRSVHDNIDVKKTRHKQKQPKEKTNTQAANTHTHTNTGSRGKSEHSQLAFPTLPEKHDSKKRVTPE